MKNGNDKGLAAGYWGLSYRRKFIRTLWTLAISPVLLVIPHLSPALARQSQFYLFLFGLSLIVGVLQGTYNYIKWQSEVDAVNDRHTREDRTTR
jgi:hypothetical protein